MVNWGRFLSVFSVFFLIAQGAYATATNTKMKCADLPKSWQPAISFSQFKWGKDSRNNKIKIPVNFTGTFFVEVLTDGAKAQSRIKRIMVAYNLPKEEECTYLIEHSIELSELQFDKKGNRNNGGYVVKEREGRKVMTLIAPDVTEQGGNIRLRVLKEAGIVSNDYSDPAKLEFSVKLENVEIAPGVRKDAVIARIGGKKFDFMEVEVRMKSFPFKGTIPAGVNRIGFCEGNCDAGKLQGLDFVP